MLFPLSYEGATLVIRGRVLQTNTAPPDRHGGRAAGSARGPVSCSLPSGQQGHGWVTVTLVGVPPKLPPTLPALSVTFAVTS